MGRTRSIAGEVIAGYTNCLDCYKRQDPAEAWVLLCSIVEYLVMVGLKVIS